MVINRLLAYGVNKPLAGNLMISLECVMQILNVLCGKYERL